MRKILLSLAAAGVLVTAVATTAVITGSSAGAQEAPAEDAEPSSARPERGSIVQEVLDDLVANGDIGLTQDQADAIVAALQDKWEELKANRPDDGPRRGRGRHGAHLRGLFEDGVIDAAELSALPEGHPLNDPEGPFAEVASDGEITTEEFRSVVEQLRADGEGRIGRPGPRFGGDAPNAEGTST